LGERVLIELELVAGLPRARQLQLIENTEFHDVSPEGRLVVSSSVFAVETKSSRHAIPRGGCRLAPGA
jgi:hypothetical protein